MKLSFSGLAEDFGLMFLKAEVAKASKWAAVHIGNPQSEEAQTALLVAQAGLAIGAEAVAAHPDHPELRSAAEDALATLSQALHGTAPTPAPEASDAAAAPKEADGPNPPVPFV